MSEFGKRVLLDSVDRKQESFDDYPEAAKENAQQALDWREEHGRDEVEGGTRTGWTRANQLASGEAISRETLGRMAAFGRHEDNAEIDAEYEGEPWKDNGYVAWLLWGGDEGIEWAQQKLDELEGDSDSALFGSGADQFALRKADDGIWEIDPKEFDDPCWEGYTMVGTKPNGNPRCVPDDDVPDAEQQLDQRADDTVTLRGLSDEALEYITNTYDVEVL